MSRIHATTKNATKVRRAVLYIGTAAAIVIPIYYVTEIYFPVAHKLLDIIAGAYVLYLACKQLWSET